MNKIEVGKKYRNLHTRRICEVLDKVFFNVAYLDEGEPSNRNQHYCHYRMFQKNWVEVKENE